MTVTAAQQNLTNLLRYAEEVLKVGEKVVSDLATASFLTIHEKDVRGLEGVAIGTDDGSWVRFERLREIPPPAADPMFDGWLIKQTTSRAFERPRLSQSRLVKVAPEEASDLVEAGLADSDDVMDPVEPRLPDQVDVLLRLERLTEFASAFAAYVEGPWAAWAAAEQPRRRAIAIYNKLYTVQQRMIALGDDVPEECVLGVGIARWEHPLGRVNVPLIEAAVELALDPEDGSITVSPRPQAPRLCLRAFDALEIAAVGRLNNDGGALLERIHNDPDIGFSPFLKESFEPVLRMCSARLSPSAIYEPDIREDADDRSPPSSGEHLRISDTWVIYVRQRSVDFRCDDIRKLIDRVRQAEDDGSLPPPAVQMTTATADKPIDDEVFDADFNLVLPMAPAAAGLPERHVAPSRGDGAESRDVRPDRPIFFPLPFNAEQVAIIRRLEDPAANGVVVQGPPGTGKTHTIANIICHYMATGRRVLVTARTPEALSAIQEKLPPEIRDLAIAVIHSDRQGAQQLEQAVEMLSSQVKQIDMADYRQTCADKERRLAEVRAEMEAVDGAIRDYATMNLSPVVFRGEQHLPMNLATKVEEERTRHAWLPDQIDSGPQWRTQFTDADVAEARAARRALGGDIIYPSSQLPDASALPGVPRMLAAHQALTEEREMEGRMSGGDLPTPSLVSQEDAETARSLLAWLQAFSAWWVEVEQADAWLLDLYRLLCGATPSEAPVRDGMRQISGEWAALIGEGEAFLLRGIAYDGASGDAAFDAALEALAAGRKPFGLMPFGKSKLRAALDAVRIDGHAPADAQEWRAVLDHRRWQGRVTAFIGRWSAAARAIGLPQLPDEWAEASEEFRRLGRLIARLEALRTEVDERMAAVAGLFPYGVDANRVVRHGEAARVCEALAAAVQKDGNVGARALKRDLAALPYDAALPFGAALDEIRSALGAPEVTSQELADGWRGLLEEANRLDALRADRIRLEAVAAAVQSSGAPVWASKLLTDPAIEGDDAWTPGGWKEAWEWSSIACYLRRISDREHAAALSSRRAALDSEQRKLLAEIVRLRTFMGLRRGITTGIASALTKFAMTVRKLGAGTGKSAERHRRAIREAAMEAAGAVPCWILPEWRVAEQLPSELGLFHLVVIDEASQSDITALPAVMRGLKLLIVGDDRQVSPTPVGMEERTVIQLRETFLRGMPIASYLDPATSMYDLASMMFPGTTIMLREHFRCVEPIIRFSSRLCYKDKGGLVPLRVPTADQRFDPPLIDIYVKHGKKQRDINGAEAEAVVDEIKQLVADPAHAHRTIGVISLIGDKQAKHINDLLGASLGFDAMERHRIMCGNASTFQGQERDVMFLTMVACPQTLRAQTTRSTEQRLNVAMSRARDRVYLVRSVTSSMMSPKDLKLALLEHFDNPMGDVAVSQPADILELCESPFEREVGGRLLKLGYRLRPQVAVGSYRIDFVVEGVGDRRLAVELDGDTYHGPDKWIEDLYRQRALERMGWRFWRCWGSHWRADPEGCMDDLVALLDKMGIEPLTGAHPTFVYTEHRTVEAPDAGRQPSKDTNGEGIDGVDRGAPIAVVELDPQPETAMPRGGASDRGTSAGQPAHDAIHGLVVEPGDTVIVRFEDNRVRRFILSVDSHRPEHGVVHVGQPIGRALLGTGLEEEVEFVVDGKSRTAVVEKISKAMQYEAAD